MMRDDSDRRRRDGESRPINPKVPAAGVGAGAGVIIGELLVSLLENAVGADIPGSGEGLIVLLVTAGLAFLAGYVKKGPA